MRFWLNKGVDGFSIQGVEHLVENNDTSEAAAGYQEGNFNLIKRWRAIANTYSDKPGRERYCLSLL